MQMQIFLIMQRAITLIFLYVEFNLSYYCDSNLLIIFGRVGVQALANPCAAHQV